MSFIGIISLALAIAGEQVARLDLDATRLQTGSFSFRTLVEGKEVGRSRIQIHRAADSGNYVFSNLVTGSFSQSWEAVATPRFAPVSAKLSFGQGSGARTAFELSYQGNRVTGFMASRKEPSKRREIDENASDDTVDQRIDWAAVMALKEYVEGKEFQFHVYDPGTGNSVVSGRIGKNVKMKDGKEKNVVPMSTAEYGCGNWKWWLNNTTVTLGMQNVTDEDPPFVAGNFENGYDESLTTIKGRFWYVGLKKRF